MATKKRHLSEPPEPPSTEDLLEVFRRVVPEDYASIVENDKSWALIRGLAASWARVADGIAKSVQARYHLPSAYQTHPPASSASKATGSVTLTRTGKGDFTILALPGEMRIQGPGGRVYLNAEPVYWTPGDFSSKSVLFECEVPGFIGNLDWLADENDELELELFSVVNQDRDRANHSGSVLATSASHTTAVRDSGRPSLFSHSDVGLYLSVTNSAHPENVGQLRKIVAFLDSSGSEHPAGSGLFPNRLGLSALVRRNPTDTLVEDNSGPSFTNYWMEAVDTNATFEPYPATPAVGDALYIGGSLPFAGVSLELTAGDVDWTVVWEYWDGAAWQEIPDVHDRTQGWTRDDGQILDPANTTVVWEPPQDWAQRTSPAGGAVQSYYVRARISALATATTNPIVSRVTVHELDPLTEEDQTLTWSILDYGSLGVSLEAVGSLSGGRDNDLYLLGRDRGMYQQPGETDDAFRKRVTSLPDVVSPNAVLRTVNKALAPYHVRGNAIDVGTELTGVFMDVDPALAPGSVGAFDLYSPGDAEPTDPWILALSVEEAYGYGLVLVPPLGFGDFGAFFDEGPVYFDEPAEVFSSSSFTGWADGYAVEEAAVYSAIHTTLDKVTGGGIHFDIVKDSSLV